MNVYNFLNKAVHSLRTCKIAFIIRFVMSPRKDLDFTPRPTWPLAIVCFVFVFRVSLMHLAVDFSVKEKKIIMSVCVKGRLILANRLISARRVKQPILMFLNLPFFFTNFLVVQRKIFQFHSFNEFLYSSNEIRKTKNEHLNIVCQNLIGL